MKFGIKLIVCAVFVTLALGACQKTYYAVWEKMGKEKRHLLKEEVEDTRTDQKEASEQFQSTLDKIKQIYGFEGGELEEFYKNLSSDYEECQERADDVSDRIEKVERIASDLFEEWDKEIGTITNSRMRTQSKAALRDTRKRYKRLHKSMTKAEASMKPVLKNLNDYVLYMKHNLNARAIGALKREVGSIETEVESLITDMNRSIKEAELFLKEF
jgi:hypothetical protein